MSRSGAVLDLDAIEARANAARNTAFASYAEHVSDSLSDIDPLVAAVRERDAEIARLRHESFSVSVAIGASDDTCEPQTAMGAAVALIVKERDAAKKRITTRTTERDTARAGLRNYQNTDRDEAMKLRAEVKRLKRRSEKAKA
jgi:hypothetical protein